MRYPGSDHRTYHPLLPEPHSGHDMSPVILPARRSSQSPIRTDGTKVVLPFAFIFANECCDDACPTRCHRGKYLSVWMDWAQRQTRDRLANGRVERHHSQNGVSKGIGMYRRAYVHNRLVALR